ncbi:hypothetical protein EDC94DRAFT_145629 [Helicostylum pulchrum]|nr:hypothetical protein EDC94DRAFT_145629 [Helicostylum pulchrum]
MSFSIENTSFISSVTEVDEGIGTSTTDTIESTTTIEESETVPTDTIESITTAIEEEESETVPTDTMESITTTTEEEEESETVPIDTMESITTTTEEEEESETVPTDTMESITTTTEEEEESETTVPTYIAESYLNDAPITTTEPSTSTIAADKLIPDTLNSDITITQEPTVMESSMISYTQPATDTPSPSPSSYDAADNLSDGSIAALIVVGVFLMIALTTLYVILKIKKKRKRVVSPTTTEKSISRHTFKSDDTLFYVDSAAYNSGANMSFVIDKPEQTYNNDTLNETYINTTSLFPPVHRSNKVYSISSSSPHTSTIYRQELINYGRESNQTMGRANGRSLHESILIGGETRQNSTCSSYHASLYSNKQELHKMTLWDDGLLDAWSTEDRQLVNPSINS